MTNRSANKLSCLLICGHCKHFACWHNRHIADHFKRNSNHTLAVSLENGEIYCSVCKDFVYYSVSDKIQRKVLNTYYSCYGISSHPWRPSFDEISFIPHISGMRYSLDITYTRSIRGLLNMGNTCFLNVVVQALTHTPVLREYLLADVHRCETPAQSKNCLACEMIRVTQEIYRCNSTPFVPSNLLHSIWLHASHLAGYEQRDAHEFLITLLTLMHSHLTSPPSPIGSDNNSNSSSLSSTNETSLVSVDSGVCFGGSNTSSASSASSFAPSSVDPAHSCLIDSAASSLSLMPVTRRKRHSSVVARDNSCDCVIHQIFFGDLKSVISYDGCEHHSTIVDPFLDLSLDVIQRKSTSLNACLQAYFQPEKIEGPLLCAKCNIKRPAVKQFSLLHLPNVLCFYLKRCLHDGKFSTSISFPMDLDLAPFMPELKAKKSLWQDRYSLYAVLNHSGQSNSGHYVAYIRADRNAWYLCDDQKVIPVTQDYVLKTDAYVLLYHKNLLAVNS
ncbi:Ubiquitin carboxyl-terminal hydrolase 51 [Cichlidogyrus casuarinus]|uniref:Ubiquitin carboxyl-terminal hydrolase n=1 Tax=Cichlidogyrus casuarinus TaxID=1844966 RepID=A0ABD2QNQ1_9PLAT